MEPSLRPLDTRVGAIDGDPQAPGTYSGGCCSACARNALITVVADCYLAGYPHAAWTSSSPWDLEAIRVPGHVWQPTWTNTWTSSHRPSTTLGLSRSSPADALTMKVARRRTRRLVCGLVATESTMTVSAKYWGAASTRDRPGVEPRLPTGLSRQRLTGVRLVTSDIGARSKPSQRTCRPPGNDATCRESLIKSPPSAMAPIRKRAALGVRPTRRRLSQRNTTGSWTT